MKNKDKFLLVIAALQPMFWWAIYNALIGIATLRKTDGGLGLSCIFSCMAIMITISIYEVDKHQK